LVVGSAVKRSLALFMWVTFEGRKRVHNFFDPPGPQQSLNV
jgi:hypothetical protein